MSRYPVRAWIFRCALRLFPQWFRDRYEDEMVAGLVHRSGTIRREAGRIAATAFLLRSVLEVPAAALSVRRSARPVSRDPRASASWMDDVRQAVRSLRRAPGWTAVALLILTLGIGGTTAVFSVLNAVLLRPLPLEEPERLVSLWTVNERQDLPDGSSWENARDWVELGTSLEDVTLVYRPEFTSATVSSLGQPERIHVGLVSPNFFDVLGVDVVVGRAFGPADLGSDARVAVISEGLWRARFAAEPEAIGRSLTIDGEEVVIVGVAPDDLAIPLRETVVWQLHDVRPQDDSNWRGYDAFWAIGRLRPSVDPASAQADLDRVALELAARYPETNADRGVSVTPLRDEIVGEELPLLLWTLFGSMVLVLLIGGTNVAQLMLSRGIERRRELAVRASLGATRSRLNRQLVLESSLLSLMAGVYGVGLAVAGLRGFTALVPPDVPRIDDVTIDGTVLGLSLLVSAVLAPLVGTLPMMLTSRTDVALTLRAGGRGATGRDRQARSLLVVAEVAMAVLLLGSAGLLVRSAVLLQRVDPGFDARHTLVARADLTIPDEGGELERVQRAIVDQLSSHPDVVGVGLIGQFIVERIPDQTITFVGDDPRPPDEPAPRLTTDMVLPGFFEGLGVPILRGTAFDAVLAGDAAEQTVLVNRAWVETFSPDQDPVGRQFRWGSLVEGDAMTVVGVVGDVRRTTLSEAAYPQMYLPGVVPGVDVLVRTVGDPVDVADVVREVVARVDERAALSRVERMWDRYESGMASRSFQTTMLGALAALATLLAAIGLFAILHDTVASRRREIGVRVALGAAPSDVRGMVLGQAIRLGALGLTLGLGALLGLSEISARLVYGITPSDPVTLGAVVAVLGAVIVLAAGLPALQATRVPPAEVLGDG